MVALIALAGGFLSFISPCVLPIVPVYIAYISGVSIASKDKKSNGKPMLFVLITSVVFVAGFTTAFTLIAVIFDIVFSFVSGEVKNIINIIAGAMQLDLSSGSTLQELLNWDF